MEHCGCGDIKIMDNYDLINNHQNIHHQFKYQVLHGNMLTLEEMVDFRELKLMEQCGQWEVILKEDWD